MSHLNTFNFLKKPILLGLIVFAITLALTQYLSYQRFLIRKNKDQKEIVSHANWLENEFQSILNQSYSSTQTLSFIVKNYGVPKNFDSISELLLKANKQISALELVDSTGVITHVYPLKGNNILGFNILKDSTGKKGAIKTINKRNYFVTGPIPLKQGGDGFVGRTPIFKGGKFYGFSAAVIKLEDLLNSIILNITDDSKFSYQLAKVNADTSEEVFFSSNFYTTKDAHHITVATSDGEWKLYIISNQNKSFSVFSIFSIFGIILSILAGALSWYIIRQPLLLNKQVKEKTNLLSESEEKHRTFIEEATDGIFITDQETNIIEVNIAGCKLTGYSKSELLKMNIRDDLSPKDNLDDINLKLKEIQNGKDVLFERKLIKKNGNIIYTEKNAKMLPSGNILAIIRDTTDRKQLEIIAQKSILKIKESEEKYRILVEEASDGIFLLDIKAKILSVNTHFCKMLGSDKEEFIGEKISKFIDPENWKAVPFNYEGLANGKTIRNLRKLVRKDGTVFYADTSVKRMPNNLYQGIIHDVTEREKAVEIVRESELKYRELTERISDGFVALDKKWNFIYVNTKAGEIINRNPVQLLGKNVWEEFPKYKETEFYEELHKTMETQKYKYIENHSKYQEKWFEYHFHPSEEGISIYFRDITEIKKAEKKIQDAKLKMEAAIRIGKIGYWSWDLKSEHIEWSEHMYSIFDVDKDIVLKYDIISERIHPDDRKNSDELIKEFIEKEKENIAYTHKVIHRDGSVHTVLLEIEIEKNHEGEVYKLHGTVIDITETIKAKEALKESEEKFYKSFHSNLIGKVIFDQNRKIIETNDAFASLFDTTRQELIGKNIIEAGVLDSENNQQNEIRDSIWDKLKETGAILDEEITFTLKNGKKVSTIFSVKSLTLESNTNYLMSVIDNTKRKEAEQKLETQNLELKKTNSELDRFVYSASHELRAPLASVLGLIKIILNEETKADLVFKVEMIEQSVQRLDSFIRDIVQYSQNKHLNIASEKIEFRNLLNESLESLWYLENREKINIDVVINEEIGFFSDIKRISIILNNLISNAIKYHDIEKSNPTINITINTSVKEAVIEVSDNGVGIPDEHLNKIFDMFYRVSSKVMGTGIGLFVIKEIVSKINGNIEVKSKETEGTTFKITLPNQQLNKK